MHGNGKIVMTGQLAGIHTAMYACQSDALFCRTGTEERGAVGAGIAISATAANTFASLSGVCLFDPGAQSSR